MHIIITGVHIEITEAIRDYALEKMRTLDKLVSGDDTSAKLTVEISKTSNHHVHGQVFQAEGILHTRGKETVVHSRQEDLYKAIDTLKDMLTRELTQHKDKERSSMRRAAHKLKSIFKRN